MKRTKLVLVIIPLAISLTNCSKSTNQEANFESDSSAIELSDSSDNVIKDSVETDNSTPKDIESDSVELTQLIRQVYTWRSSNKLDDFPYQFDQSSPNIFIGIDWDRYDKNISKLIKTNFFSDDFFSNHKAIALSLDSSIRKADIEWRNIQDGISLWSTNADDWCSCQDNPDEYWKILTITDLQCEDKLATFYWTWDSGPTDYPHNYKVTAKKTNKEWRISSLDGFKYYQSVDYYDDIMNDNNSG